jgi:hypothetical protein
MGMRTLPLQILNPTSHCETRARVGRMRNS